jgi:hypothetical protein
MKRPARHSHSAALLLLLLPAAACSKSGGGGDSIAPVFIGASFAGSGPTPATGDQLLLSFSEDVTADISALIGDADLAISGGGTLGTGTTVLDQPTTRSVRLLLGPGATFLPDTSTVTFAPSNTAIADLAGNPGDGGDPVLIDTGDGAVPTLTNLTLDDIDDVLNGTGPAGGVLQVPQNGFVVDLAYGDSGSPGAPLGVDPARTQLTANVAVNTASGSQAAGINLLPFLTAITANSSVGSYGVPGNVTFPTGPVTLTAVVLDGGGMASNPVTFSFTVRAFSDATRPFETTVNSQQVWFLDISRDVESFTTSVIPGGVSVDVAVPVGSNGRSDYLDVLLVLGLQSLTPIPNVSGSDDSNAVAQARLRTAIIGHLATLFAGCNIAFTFTQPPGSFGSNSSVAYNSLGYSQICIGGSDDEPVLAILGVAQLDPSNQRQNNDCLLESQTTSRLGVFLHTIADDGLGPPSGSTFRTTFSPFTPSLGGTPIGNDAQDGQRLLGTLGDARATLIDAAIDRKARFIAVIVAHECGHSMGLVVSGAMPLGLYGGDSVNFPGSTDGHIRTQSLFPGGATNVMSPALGFDFSLNAATAFNSLNIAYLREQAFYGN